MSDDIFGAFFLYKKKEKRFNFRKRCLLTNFLLEVLIKGANNLKEAHVWLQDRNYLLL